MRRIAVVSVLVALFAGLALAASPPEPSPAKGLILLVRHAERPPLEAPGDDPSLTDAGKARAERLPAAVASYGVRAIYVTRFRRTQETAKPTADRLGLVPIVESDTNELVTALRKRNAETVLVVGHSDTLPDVIEAFGGPAIAIDDDDYDDLFVLTPATGAVTRLAY
jgi:broad specificity phosphatase PhoE